MWVSIEELLWMILDSVKVRICGSHKIARRFAPVKTQIKMYTIVLEKVKMNCIFK